MAICIRRAEREDIDSLLELTLKECPRLSPQEAESHVRTELSRSFAKGQYFILERDGVNLGYTLIAQDEREDAYLNLKEFYLPLAEGGELLRELILDSEFSYRNTYTKVIGIQPNGILTRIKNPSEAREKRLQSIGYQYFTTVGEQEIWRKLFTTAAADISLNPEKWRGKA
ncbi:hypothetical protein HZA98_05100 [Candidatus Woesearchaeota archaeon]|nr:hypothetical protein [Candidatus Woesearchaeota archaeon]